MNPFSKNFLFFAATVRADWTNISRVLLESLKCSLVKQLVLLMNDQANRLTRPSELANTYGRIGLNIRASWPIHAGESTYTTGRNFQLFNVSSI